MAAAGPILLRWIWEVCLLHLRMALIAELIGANQHLGNHQFFVTFKTVSEYAVPIGPPFAAEHK